MRHGVERLPGAHCYGSSPATTPSPRLHDAEPGTFYLTDFLARHFDAPRLAAVSASTGTRSCSPDYFGNYRRLVYLRRPTTTR